MNFLQRAIRAPLALIPAGTVMPVLSGPLRGYRWIVGSGTHGCWIGTYELTAQRVLASLIRRGMTVYDVGANVGFFTLLAVRLGARVVAYEPSPRNVEYLKRHLAMNGIRDVTIVQAAVSGRNGIARFDPGQNPSMGRLDSEGSISVPTVTLGGSPDLIKMDIEGGEVEALSGADLSGHPIVYLSTHGTLRHERCLNILIRAGYRCRVVFSDGDWHMDVLAG